MSEYHEQRNKELQSRSNRPRITEEQLNSEGSPLTLFLIAAGKEKAALCENSIRQKSVPKLTPELTPDRTDDTGVIFGPGTPIEDFDEPMSQPVDGKRLASLLIKIKCLENRGTLHERFKYPTGNRRIVSFGPLKFNRPVKQRDPVWKPATPESLNPTGDPDSFPTGTDSPGLYQVPGHSGSSSPNLWKTRRSNSPKANLTAFMARRQVTSDPLHQGTWPSSGSPGQQRGWVRGLFSRPKAKNYLGPELQVFEAYDREWARRCLY